MNKHTSLQLCSYFDRSRKFFLHLDEEFRRLRKSRLEPLYFDGHYEMKAIVSHSKPEWGYELVIEWEDHGMSLSSRTLQVEYGFQEQGIWITNIRKDYSVYINLNYADVLKMGVTETAAAYIKVEGTLTGHKYNHLKM